MPSWLIYVIGCALVLAITFRAMSFALKAKYEQGKTQAEKICTKEKLDAYAQGAESRKEIDIKVTRLSTDDAFKLLDDLGMLRD